MKKEASIDKFNKEHKVKGFIAYDTGSLRFYVDDDYYSLTPFGSEGFGGYPIGLTVYQKKKGEKEKKELFDLYVFSGAHSNPETTQYDKMLAKLKKENKNIERKDYVPYIIWHLTHPSK